MLTLADMDFVRRPWGGVQLEGLRKVAAGNLNHSGAVPAQQWSLVHRAQGTKQDETAVCDR